MAEGSSAPVHAAIADLSEEHNPASSPCADCYVKCALALPKLLPLQLDDASRACIVVRGNQAIPCVRTTRWERLYAFDYNLSTLDWDTGAAGPRRKAVPTPIAIGGKAVLLLQEWRGALAVDELPEALVLLRWHGIARFYLETYERKEMDVLPRSYLEIMRPIRQQAPAQQYLIPHW